MLMKAFGKYSYMAAGLTETMKGLLAFVSSPVFGRLSDKIGTCSLLITTIIQECYTTKATIYSSC